MRSPRRLLILLVASAAPALSQGCGADRPEFDPKAQYTPESLAQELAFRFRDLPENRKGISPRPAKKAAPLKDRDLSKSGEATKEAAADTADTVIEDVAAKIRSVKGVPPAEFCKRVVEAVKKDDSLKPADRAALAKRLEDLAARL